MIVDLFAGPGGWDEGLRLLDLPGPVIGIEWDAAACATRAAAGHLTVRADVAAYDPARFAGATGLIASPPCTAFSAAGKRAALDHVPALVAAMRAGEWDTRPDPDPLIWLALEVGRWAEVTRPEWITCEQVPAALPLWEALASWLTDHGYSTWCGVLNAADYGVPQTRRRAVLIASRVASIEAPEPTHADGGTDADLFGPGRLPWVSMAAALGWVEGEAAYKGNRGAGCAERHRHRPARPDEEPAPTVLPGARSATWQLRSSAMANATVRAADEPAPTVLGSWDNGDARFMVNTGRDWKKGGTRADAQTFDAGAQPAPAIDGKGRWHVQGPPEWTQNRPATTVAGDSRVHPPGHKINQADRDRLGTAEAEARYEGRAGTNAVRVEPHEAAVLQSFPADYPWQGTRTKVFQQIGNAVPPLLAAHVVAAAARCAWAVARAA